MGEELQLIGAPSSVPGDAPDSRLRRLSALSQLGGSPLLLYIGTSIAVLATAGWVISDVSRRHQPMEHGRQAEPVTAPVLPVDGPALLPPARLGDGVVLSAPSSEPAPGVNETLNALMRQTEPVAPVASTELSAPADAVVSSQSTALQPPDAPPSPMTENVPSQAEPIAAPEATPASAAPSEASAAPVTSRCLLKVGGKVLFQQACSVERASGRATLKLGDKTLLVSVVRGETWQANYAGKSLGNVYATGSCWGRKKQLYICAD